MLKYLIVLTCVVILGVTSLCMESEKNHYSNKEHKKEILQRGGGLNPKNTC